MRSTVITPPTPVVSWADADKHLRLSGDTSQQAEVEAMVAAATATIDGPDGWLGRALGVQTIETRFDYFDPCGLELPFPPLVAITSVKYLDAAGAEQTMAQSDYEAIGSRLVPTANGTWPTPQARAEAVRVTYRAGYETIPAPIRAAILLMVGDLFANRETTIIGTSSAIAMSTSVAALLSPFRVFA